MNLGGNTEFKDFRPLWDGSLILLEGKNEEKTILKSIGYITRMCKFI